MRHRRELTSSELEREAAEEAAYQDWCKGSGLDPTDTDSMIAYEEAVGYIGWVIDEPEDHR